MTGTTHPHTPVAAGHVPARRRPSLRTAAALAAGIVVATAVAASAANLDVGTPTLGAANQTVGSCDENVTVGYTTNYDGTAKQYVVTGIKVSEIDTITCVGLTVGVSLLDSDGLLLGTSITSPALATGATVVNLSTTGTPLAAQVAKVAVVIA